MALDQAETFEWLRNRVQKLESELKAAQEQMVDIFEDEPCQPN